MQHTFPLWYSVILAYLTYLAAAGATRATIETRRQHLNHLGRHCGRPPDQLTAAELIGWAGAQAWQRETRRGRRMTFISFFDWMMTEGRRADNPARALPKVPPGLPAPRPVPERVYQDAVKRSDQRVRLMLRLAHDAGLRRGEIALVHSRDLIEDMLGWSLLVHGKGAKTRVVPLTRRLAFELRALPAGWAFPGEDDGHLSARWVGKLGTLALAEPWTLHTLRHSFASRAYAVNTDLFTVQKLLGHASPSTTQVYVYVPADSLRATVQAIGE